jgi:hypothetical protein
VGNHYPASHRSRNRESRLLLAQDNLAFSSFAILVGALYC